MNLSQAKGQLLIPILWQMLGLPGNPGKSCHAPWREDKSPSFSVSGDGTLWHDFSTGEGGDAISFLAKARGLSLGDACREFINMAGSVVPTVLHPNSSNLTQKRKLSLPSLQQGNQEELSALSSLRGISLAGLEAAQKAAILCFSTLHGKRAWIITDSARRNAQARRLDGKPWEHIGDKKAWTLPGSQARWPVGIPQINSFKIVALCEGGPDLLAAFHFIAAVGRTDIFPLGMLGAGLGIHDDALPYLAGKHVRIFPHIDANSQGYNAALKWEKQLSTVGAQVDAFSFHGFSKADGQPVKDLNDCVHAPDLDEIKKMFWEGM